MVEERPGELRIGDRWRRVIAAEGYPGTVEDGWLDNLLFMPGNFDLSMHIEPLEKDKVLGTLRRELLKQKSDMEYYTKRGEAIPPHLQTRYNDAVKVREAIENDEEKMLDLSLYISPEAETLEELDTLTKKLKTTLNTTGILPKMPVMRMKEGLKHVLSAGQEKVTSTQNITSAALAACFPFKSTNLIEMDGVLFGASKENKVPIIVDPFNMKNPNGLIIGAPGTGKSFFAKLYGMRQHMMGTTVHIIDPRGEYAEIAQTHEGEVIRFSPDSETAINPFDLTGTNYEDKSIWLHSFMHTLIEDISPAEKNLLDIAFKRICPKNKTPTMKDLYAAIEAMNSDDNHLNHSAAQALTNKLRPYLEEPMSFLNRQTNLSYNKQMVSFDISQVPDQGKAAAIFLILEHLNRVKTEEHTIIIVDDAWLLLRHPQAAQQAFENISRNNVSYALVVGETDYLMLGYAGDILLENTSWRLLLNQEPRIMDETSKTFKLNYGETMQLMNAPTGEGVLIAYDNRIPLKIIASPREIELATTKENMPRLERWANLPERPKKIVEADEPKRFNTDKLVQIKNDLTPTQVEILLRNGFREVRDPGFIKGTGSTYLVKNGTGETDPHFILWNLIYDEVRKYTDDVICNRTKAPDIVFTSKDGRRVGVEVETGRKSEQDIGRKLSVLERYDDWFIVVVNREDKEYYMSYGPTLTRITVQEKIRSYFLESTPPSRPEQETGSEPHPE